MRRVAAFAFVFLIAISARAEEPLLTLTTWGMPGSAKFVVELFANGRLRVQREMMRDAKTITRWLTKSQLRKLLTLAEDSRDFRAGCGAVSDGTNASMVLLREKGEPVKRLCENADVWPNGKRTREFLAALNRVVPGDMRVY